MGRVSGKVAFITGAARGQGRSHAIRLAQEGAAVIISDVCEQIPGIRYDLGTEDDLAETVRLVEEADGQVVAVKADVRSSEQLERAVEAGLSRFGKIDTVVANAGLSAYRLFPQLTEAEWRTTMDVNLTGVFRTVKAAVPSMIERGEGGSVILISSGSTYRGGGLLTEYSPSKAGVNGLKRSFALSLGPYGIRVNCIMPTTILTGLVDNDALAEGLARGVNGGKPFESHEAWIEAKKKALLPLHMIQEPWMEPIDISNAVLFLASDESKYVTSEDLRVDLGFAGKGG
jgi:SDR family mycofactocin-dependent oxidoreductase